ncbi:sugar transporter [Paraburkholderia phytofirmans OLGA172]|uniref:Sugar transporter n=1 Tax=Paraburkholderia phytofirmans OLGA172 TaxID=1417228 RepID=A0A160FIL6_9BURK|nr:MFS transporter [Paraburkholderia phytofirmans]ANB72119.1 sugar transporter [Paraburkholderia phytofirmans OLGA172]
MAWTKQQRSVALASYLGWTLDAFDFFLMVFVLKDIAKTFNTEISSVTIAIALTLALRPIGALIFGRLADRFGRRPVLVGNIVLFSLINLASGFASSLTMLLILRSVFGVAMGGEWGVGSALTMESIPPKSRGVMSGILQAGYPSGYLLAALVFGLLHDLIGWRGMFMVGVLPALLVLFIRRNVPESPAWERGRTTARPGILAVLVRDWKLAIYMIVLMTAFNFFSHGTQDLYPTFLLMQHKLSTHTVSVIAVVYNIGAIVGGIVFGSLSEKIGRRKAIAAAALLALPVLPLWAFASGSVALAIGAFLMQISVQGAWGVIPAYLNEMSPPDVRATFPGLVYQLGNLLASANATIQADIAHRHGDDYGMGMAIVAGTVSLVISALILLGRERRGTQLGSDTAELAEWRPVASDGTVATASR